MSRKFITGFGAIFLVLAVFGMALAFGDGNARKGKYLYRKNCRTCHGQTASDLSPNTYTQAEWAEKFQDPSTLPCSGDWQNVKENEVNDIFTYLHDYAKDSPTPAKCS